MVAFAGALLSTNLVNSYLAPHYEYTYSGQSYTVGGSPSWPTTPTGSFFDGPGQLSIDMVCGEGLAFLVGWGFEGYNNSTTGSSIRMGIHISNGASSVTAATTDLSAMTSNSGSGNAGSHHASRWHVFTGYTEGQTYTFDMQGYMSSASGTIFVDNQWLYVQQFYA